jgi:UDP-2-acetamido-2-deoxy-ribo-hexuluronate aminotransferase
MSLPFFDLQSQYEMLRDSIDARIGVVLQHGQYIMGPEVISLEARLAEFVGTKHCVAVSSGTDALLLALMAIDVQPGQEVITTPFSFISTAEVIVLLGAVPVFVDVELQTGNIDVNKLEDSITSKTAAIMPVSLYGQPSDMDEINQIAAKNGDIPVIEDGAQSFGSEYQGRKSGNLSTIGCTSFFPSKPLGCYGDGGAVFTSDATLANRIREARVHGQESRYHHTRIGLSGRLDTIQSAILLAKLEKFAWELERRKVIGQLYNDLFDRAGVERIVQRPDRTSVFGQYTILVDNRDYIRRHLGRHHIPTSVHYPTPIDAQPAYKQYRRFGTTKNADLLAKRVLSLPFGPYMSESTITKIVDLVCASN